MNSVLNSSNGVQLSSEEVTNKLKMLKSTNDEHVASKLKEDIVMSNVRLVMAIAKPYAKFQTVQYEDLFQEGIIGLYTAIDKFDTSLNVKFSTYAYFWIKQKIRRFVESMTLNDLDQNSMSIDKNVGSNDDKRMIGDMIQGDDNLLVNESKNDMHTIMKACIRHLNPIEQYVLKLRYNM